jgi:SAM-dependent methyltransferase
MSKDHIKDYWESQAREHGGSPVASWGDNWMIDLEVETIAKHLRDDTDVLDVGCSNGHGTFAQAERFPVARFTGVDFAERMIAEARAKQEGLGQGDRVRFDVGDIRALDFPDASFDVTYTTRVVINLPTWDEQQVAIRECLRVTRPGGTVVLCEGFWEPLTKLNAVRAVAGLPPLVEHDFNRYLKQERLEPFLDGLGLAWERDAFSSLYYLGSRFVRELATDPSAYPGFTNPINEIFWKIEKQFSGGDFGIQQAYVIRNGRAEAPI